MADPAALHETDFCAWTQDQAAKLRPWPEHLRPSGIDIANVAEEIDGFGRSEERAFASLSEDLFLHLLELEFYPAQENRTHWCKEANAFRRGLLKFQPTRRPKHRGGPMLWAQRHEWAEEAWRDAAEAFQGDFEIENVDQTRRAHVRLQLNPHRSHYDLDGQALNPAWFPEFHPV